MSLGAAIFRSTLTLRLEVVVVALKTSTSAVNARSVYAPRGVQSSKYMFTMPHRQLSSSLRCTFQGASLTD